MLSRALRGRRGDYDCSRNRHLHHRRRHHLGDARASGCPSCGPASRITVVEAGRSIFDAQNRGRYRQRAIDYGEHPWPGDYIEDQQADGIISMTMAVGGLALHWGGACNRFSEEDLRLKSMYGLATDWPIEWDELERYYCEAERRLNVSGEPSPHPGGSALRAVSAGPDPAVLQPADAEGVGGAERPEVLAAADGAQPDAVRRPRQLLRLRHLRRGVPVRRALLAGLHVPAADRAEEDRAARSHAGPAADRSTRRGRRSSAAQAVHQDRPGEPIEYRAKTFVVASGYCWSSHLLLLSANSRFPNGLANSSGLVGRYMNGHRFIAGDGEHRRPDVPRSEHDAQPDLARSTSAARPTSRSSGTTRACGRARPGAIRGCARRTASCCSATS